MADDAIIRYLYPPNFTSYEYPWEKGTLKCVVQCTNVSDGTGEDAIVKVDRTQLRTVNGTTPTKLVVEKIKYSVMGMRVSVHWTNQALDPIAILDGGSGSATGEIDWTSSGGNIPSTDDDVDAGDAGNICITTDNASSGDTYDITLYVKVKE